MLRGRSECTQGGDDMGKEGVTNGANSRAGSRYYPAQRCGKESALGEVGAPYRKDGEEATANITQACVWVESRRQRGHASCAIFFVK